MSLARPEGKGQHAQLDPRVQTALRQLTGQASPEEILSIEQMMSLFAGSGCDLATLVYATQIRQLDKNVADGLKQVQLIGKLREQFNDRLSALRELKDLVKAASSNDKDGEVSKSDLMAHLGAKLKAEGLSDEEIKTKGPQRLNELLEVAQQIDLSIDAKTGEIVRKVGNPLGGIIHNYVQRGPGRNNDDGWRLSVDQIDTELNRVQGQAQKLDSEREIQMILMNSQLNKKEQAVTQLTNLLKKTHDTQNAIIQNLR